MFSGWKQQTSGWVRFSRPHKTVTVPEGQEPVINVSDEFLRRVLVEVRYHNRESFGTSEKEMLCKHFYETLIGKDTSDEISTFSLKIIDGGLTQCGNGPCIFRSRQDIHDYPYLCIPYYFRQQDDAARQFPVSSGGINRMVGKRPVHIFPVHVLAVPEDD